MRARSYLLAFVGILVLHGAPALAEPPPEKDWEVRLTPYLWLPSIDGEVEVNGFTLDFNVGFEDIFKRLNLALMGEAEVRWKRVLAEVDIFWSNLGDKTDFGAFETDLELDQLIVDFRLGYRVLNTHVWPGAASPGSARGRVALDLYAGFRHWRVDTDLDVTPIIGPEFELDSHRDWFEPLVGARLVWRPLEKLPIRLRGDAGGFGVADAAEITWRASGIVGFDVSRRWELNAGYRALGVKDKIGSGLNANELDYIYHGPVLGATFHF